MRVFCCDSFEKTFEKNAHNSEILTIDYSHTTENNNQFLASGSRDRTIQLFSNTGAKSKTDYKLLESITDHSSSINAVRFVKNEKILSCGSDKSIIFRSIVESGGNNNKSFTVQRDHLKLSSSTLYDMSIDPLNKYVITAGTEKQLNIYSVTSGKQVRSRTLTSNKNETTDGAVIKVQLDPSGIYAISITNKKELALYDFYSGECVSQIPESHSEAITGAKFTSDCKRIISVSSDSCIFVWKLNESLTKEMCSVLTSKTQNEVPSVNPITTTSNNQDCKEEKQETPTTSTSSVGSLPFWASSEGGLSILDSSVRESIGPAGVWQTDPQILSNFKLYSEKDEDLIFFDMNEKRRYTVEPSDQFDLSGSDGTSLEEKIEKEKEEQLEKEKEEQEERERLEKEQNEERERQEQERLEKEQQEKEIKEKEEKERNQKSQKKTVPLRTSVSPQKRGTNETRVPLVNRKSLYSNKTPKDSSNQKSRTSLSISSSKKTTKKESSPLENLNNMLSLFETCVSDYEKVRNSDPIMSQQYQQIFGKISKISAKVIQQPNSNSSQTAPEDKENQCSNLSLSPSKQKTLPNKDFDLPNFIKDSPVFQNVLDKYSQMLFTLVSEKLNSGN